MLRDEELVWMSVIESVSAVGVITEMSGYVLGKNRDPEPLYWVLRLVLMFSFSFFQFSVDAVPWLLMALELETLLLLVTKGTAIFIH